MNHEFPGNDGPGRYAWVLRDGGIVSSVSQLQGPPDRLDKKQEETKRRRAGARARVGEAGDGSPAGGFV